MLISSILNQPVDQFCIYKMVEYATANVSSANKGGRGVLGGHLMSCRCFGSMLLIYFHLPGELELLVVE